MFTPKHWVKSGWNGGLKNTAILYNDVLSIHSVPSGGLKHMPCQTTIQSLSDTN